MAGFFAFAVLFSIAHGLILPTHHVKDSSGDGKLRSSTSELTCPDISGTYEGSNGNPVIVTQSGCAVDVKLTWMDPKGLGVPTEVLRSGTVDGASVDIKGFDKPGRLTEGNVFFGDGGQWKKVLKEPTILKTVASGSSKCADIAGNYEDKNGKPVAIYQNACFVKVKMYWDTQAGFVILPGYLGSSDVHVKDLSKPGTAASNGDITFEDGGLWKKVVTASSGTDSTDASQAVVQLSDNVASSTATVAAQTDDSEVEAECPDIHGKYKNSAVDKALPLMNDAGKEITVYQIGCFVKVKMFWNNKLGSVLKPGRIEKGQLVIKDFTDPGTLSKEGDIIFADGGLWEKADKAVEADATSTPVADAITADATTEADTNLKSVEVEDDSITKSEETSTFAEDDSITKSEETSTFAEDDSITKSEETSTDWTPEVFQAPDEPECKDIHGSYLDKKGKTVNIDQTGCDLMVKLFWSEQRGEVTLTGSARNNELSMEGISTNGHFADTGDVFFTDGGHWFKQGAVTASTQGEAANLSSVMADESADTAVMREGASDTASAEAAESLEGAQSPEDAPFTYVDGLMRQSVQDNNSNFTDNMTANASANMTGNTSVVEDIMAGLPDDMLATDVVEDIMARAPSEATQQAVDSGDCSDVHGVYTNGQGQDVSIQQDGCALTVTTFSPDHLLTVSKSGKVVGEIMKVEDFDHTGMVTSLGDIFFADGQQWEKANSTSNTPAVAEDMAVSSQDQDFAPSTNGDCTDIHGKYTSMGGQEVMVYQVGCFLKVKIHSNDEEKAALKSGRIVGEDIRVQDMHSSGRASAVGDIIFGDGSQWMRGSKAATLTSDVATDSSADSGVPNSAIVTTALANSTGNLSDMRDRVEATYSNESNTTFADASAANTSSANTTFANASANTTTWANASELNISLNSTLSSTSSVVQPADANDEDFLVDQDCPDVSGTYQTTQGGTEQEVTVYQIGCYVKVKMPLQEELTLKTGKIQGNFMYIKDLQAPGIMTLSGDILFGNGGDWHKKQFGNSSANQSSSWNEAGNGSANASINGSANVSVTSNASNGTSQTLMTLGSNGTLLDIAAAETLEDLERAGTLMDTSVTKGVQDQCPDVSGHYVTSVGKLITLAQSQCNLDVQLWWDKEHGEVLTKGTVNNNELQIDGFLEKGIRTDESVTFPAGAHWRKLSATDAETFQKDGCFDLSGYYGDQSGGVVMISQTGCHAALKAIRGSTESRPKLGHVADSELHLFDQSAPGRQMQGGNLDFGASAYWGKLTSEQAAGAAQDNCVSVGGHYRDSKGDIATITQEQCHVSVQMKWDGETGNVTLGGHIFGDLFHVKEFHSSGLISQSEPSSIDFDGAVWHKMSNEEAVALSIPEAGCDNFEGLYVDTNGKKAMLNQTGCHINVNMWWNDVLGNVAVEGHVSRGTMHLRGLNDAEKSEFGIAFGADKHWTKMDSVSTASHLEATVVADPLAVHSPSPLPATDEMKPYDVSDELMDINPLMR